MRSLDPWVDWDIWDSTDGQRKSLPEWSQWKSKHTHSPPPQTLRGRKNQHDCKKQVPIMWLLCWQWGKMVRQYKQEVSPAPMGIHNISPLRYCEWQGAFQVFRSQSTNQANGNEGIMGAVCLDNGLQNATWMVGKTPPSLAKTSALQP